ncbi:hypothetical protein P3T73_03310 [Kiritimatiellota bacterium B12222]|nr:hypothetical protein P3T73_03310 [Kiritimatiellota bacterium B12222]
MKINKNKIRNNNGNEYSSYSVEDLGVDPEICNFGEVDVSINELIEYFFKIQNCKNSSCVTLFSELTQWEQSLSIRVLKLPIGKSIFSMASVYCQDGIINLILKSTNSASGVSNNYVPIAVEYNSDGTPYKPYEYLPSVLENNFSKGVAK